MTVPGYVLQWARLPGPGRLLAELRARLEGRGLGDRARVDVGLTPAERAEVGRMIRAGWVPTGEAVAVADLRAGLREHGVELEALLVALGGPLRNRRAEESAAREARREDHARATLLLGAPVADPASDPAAALVLKRLLESAPSREGRAREILRVVDAARAGGQIRLGVLAAQLFDGDAHALDRSTRLGRAVARYLAWRELGSASWVDPLQETGGWARAWESAGVLCDGVSSQVLVLNLPLVGTAPAVALCAAAPGEPVWLSLRSLEGSLALADGVTEVHVCENPVIVEEAADRFGAASRPLVCTFGVPTVATYRLLAALDARLWVRADGDDTGWGIVRGLLERHPRASTWRMPEGSRLFEEEVLDALMSDLSPTPRR